MASNYSTLQASALLWSMASLGNSGNGSGGSGTPGKDGNNWIIVNEPLSDGFSAPLGSKEGDLIVDSDTEVFRVVNQGGNLVVVSTGVTLRPESEQQKSLYQLYLGLEPMAPALTESQFRTRFLEALEDNPQFNLYEFYKSNSGVEYLTEQEFNEHFVALMDFDFQALETSINALKTTVNNLSDKVTSLETQHTQDIKDLTDKINTVDTKVDNLEAKHDADLDALREQHQSDVEELSGLIDGLTTENSKLKQDVADLQEQFTNLENNVVVVINKFLQDNLPGIVADEVAKQLENWTPPEGGSTTCCDILNTLTTANIIDGNKQEGEKTKIDLLDGNYISGPNIIVNGCSCSCCIPKFIIDGASEWTEEIKESLVIFWNGDANTRDFEYVVETEGDTDGKIAWAGDADPSDDDESQFMSFDDWIKFHGLETIYANANDDDKQDMYNTYKNTYIAKAREYLKGI